MISPWMAFSHWGLDAEEDQGRADRAEQCDADQGAPEAPAAAGDGHAAHDDRGDDLELQASAGVGIDVGEADGVEQGGQAGQGAHDDEDA